MGDCAGDGSWLWLVGSVSVIAGRSAMSMSAQSLRPVSHGPYKLSYSAPTTTGIPSPRPPSSNSSARLHPLAQESRVAARNLAEFRLLPEKLYDSNTNRPRASVLNEMVKDVDRCTAGSLEPQSVYWQGEAGSLAEQRAIACATSSQSPKERPTSFSSARFHLRDHARQSGPRETLMYVAHGARSHCERRTRACMAGVKDRYLQNVVVVQPAKRKAHL